MNFFDHALEIIFPPKCGICGKIGEGYICNNCYNMFVINKIYKSYNRERFHMLKYEGIIRDKLIEYKFNDKPYLYRMFYEILIKDKNACDFLKGYDIIIPVPIHKKRKSLRGYNQSELIAKKLSDEFKMPMYIDVLKKQINTIPQSSLGKKARKSNAQNVYKVDNMQKIKNKNVVILDDIYTTGATANECIKVLKDAGAYRVGIITIAKD